MSALFSSKKRTSPRRLLQDKTLQLLVPNSERLEGYTQMGILFLQKSTNHSKIPRSATRFHSRKHSDDACSCSARPEGTRRGFQSSTMKCLGVCRYGTHGIPHKEGRRSSLTRISFPVNLVVVLFCNPTRNPHCKPTRTLAS